MTTEKTPNPGSSEARQLGCTCPVMDNRYGLGIYFTISETCPIHGEQEFYAN